MIVKRLPAATITLVLAFVTGPILAADEEADNEHQNAGQVLDDSAEASLQELLDVQISSVSRKLEPLSKASAAIYVLTGEDIRRLGATSLPEALRGVPGLHVARIDANKWSISSRGFATQYSNKLLVLIDGRTVYTPLFSGVYWDAQDLVMEDIDRIEVIRGPGAALWGANAVNGVINVITKSAKETEGLLVSAGGGSQEGYGAARYGASHGEDLSYRVFAKYSNVPEQQTPLGEPATDAWDMVSGGARFDWTKERSAWTLLGNVYRGRLDTGLSTFTLAPPALNTVVSRNETSGANFLSRWTRHFGLGNSMTLQAYYDHYKRDEPRLAIENRDTFDLDFQHGLVLGSHDLLWGARYRYSADDLPEGPQIRWDPPQRNDQLVSLFAQDRISFASDAMRLTLGSKFEHNDYTGFEVQPNLRLAWLPGIHAFWGAVSRAVRTPARFEHGFEVEATLIPTPQGPSALLILQGNPAFDSEEVVDYEFGYRVQPTSRFSLDVTTFYNDYRNLSSLEPVGPPTFVPFPTPRLEIRQTFQNLIAGNGRGAEIVVNFLPRDGWRLTGSYSYLNLDLVPDATSQNETAENPEGRVPRNQFRLQSFLDLPGRFELDGALHYVDALPTESVPSFTRVDLRFGWRATERLDLSVVGTNLLDAVHPEFGSGGSLSTASWIERSVTLQLRWR